VYDLPDYQRLWRHQQQLRAAIKRRKIIEAAAARNMRHRNQRNNVTP